jgi:hypothetical protein
MPETDHGISHFWTRKKKETAEKAKTSFRFRVPPR